MRKVSLDSPPAEPWSAAKSLSGLAGIAAAATEHE